MLYTCRVLFFEQRIVGLDCGYVMLSVHDMARDPWVGGRGFHTLSAHTNLQESLVPVKPMRYYN